MAPPASPAAGLPLRVTRLPSVEPSPAGLPSTAPAGGAFPLPRQTLGGGSGGEGGELPPVARPVLAIRSPAVMRTGQLPPHRAGGSPSPRIQDTELLPHSVTRPRPPGGPPPACPFNSLPPQRAVSAPGNPARVIPFGSAPSQRPPPVIRVIALPRATIARRCHPPIPGGTAGGNESAEGRPAGEGAGGGRDAPPSKIRT